MKNLVLDPFLLFAIIRLTAEQYYYKIWTCFSKKKLPKHLIRQSCRQKKIIEKIFQNFPGPNWLAILSGRIGPTGFSPSRRFQTVLLCTYKKTLLLFSENKRFQKIIFLSLTCRDESSPMNHRKMTNQNVTF